MSLNLTGIIGALEDHACASGEFQAVNLHEPKSAPGSGLTAAIWAQDIGPAPAASGLGATTVRVEVWVRIYTPLIMEPPDMIDPAVVGAADALLDAYSGDFTLGGLIRDVDLLGEHGMPLRADAGYLEVDRRLYRVMDVKVPMIVNDVYTQAA